MMESLGDILKRITERNTLMSTNGDAATFRGSEPEGEACPDLPGRRVGQQDRPGGPPGLRPGLSLPLPGGGAAREPGQPPCAATATWGR